MPYKDSNRQKEYLKDWNARRRDAANAARKEIKSSGCVVCGESEMCCLSLHHVDPSQKDKKISDNSMRASVDKIIEEAMKCVVLCENCHRKVHAGIISI